MGSLLRFRARKDDGTIELTLGLSKGLVIGLVVCSIGVISLGYAVKPVQSKQEVASRAKKALGSNKFYSASVEAGDYVFLAGKVASKQGKIVEGGIKEETKFVLDACKADLAKSGLTLDDVVKVTVYLGKLDDYQAMNEVYQTYFPQGPPARSTVVTGLVLGAGVEIDMIAYRGK